MSTTTTTTTTTKASEAKSIAAFDRPVRLRGVDQRLAAMPEPAADLFDALRGPRRFAPQLVDTSRRFRRDGDTGLRAADRTDASPYARHGFSDLRSRMRCRSARVGRTRTGGAMRGMPGEKTEARTRDLALDIFPNSRPRQGGAAHYFFISDDDTASESCLSFAASSLEDEPRRRSTDMSWWHPTTQTSVEAEQGAADVPAVQVRDADSKPECGAPKPTPADTKQHVMECPAHMSTVGDTPLMAPKPRAAFRQKPAAIRTGEKREVDPEYEAMRRAASPPLLGSDLVFPRCESPESCPLTTDLPFSQRATEEKRRDPTQKCGLWGGYCFNRGEVSPVVDASKLTPPGNSGLWPGRGDSGPRALAPTPPPTPTGMWAAPASRAPSQGLSPFQDTRMEAERPRSAPPQRLSPFQGAGAAVEAQRPRSPPAKPSLSPEEKERRIEAEFTDSFVTQLYSYLSLGYPVMARAFDEELCAMSGVGVEELRERDDEVMQRGHVCDGEVGRWAAQRCPRWRALREYVRGWAREQEDLDVTKGHGAGMASWGGRGSWMP